MNSFLLTNAQEEAITNPIPELGFSNDEEEKEDEHEDPDDSENEHEGPDESDDDDLLNSKY